jgi:hypothetical protein
MAKDKLPPIEDFSFKSIMKSIKSSVAGDLDAIAEICARSQRSQSNRHEARMQHGKGDPPQLNYARNSAQGSGVGSGDEQSKKSREQLKPVAYRMLESTMSSSKSPEEEAARK